MRARLAAAPFWIYGLVSGVLFGTAMTVFSASRDDGGNWSVRIVIGVLAGILFGVGMGVVVRRDFGASRDELAALPTEQRRAVLRAAVRSGTAADPAARAMAARQVQRLLALHRRRARFTVVGASLAMVLYAAMALTESPWWWFAFAMFAAAIAAQLATPRRLERRLAALAAPPRRDQ